MPKVNLDEVLDLEAWVETQAAMPERLSSWHQRTYFMPGARLGRDCGTAYCAAGRTAVKHGAEPADPGLPQSSCLRAVDSDNRLDVFRYHSDDPVVFAVSIHDRAKRILGLTEDEASELFYGLNDLDDMREAFGKIKARAAMEAGHAEH